jgi:Tetratricopeptide repeat.
MRNPALLLLIPIFCVFELTTAGVAGATTEFEQGKQLYDSQHYRQAAETFAGLLKDDKKAPALTHYYYANSLWKIGKKDEALAVYRRVVELSPQSQIAKYSLTVLSKSETARVTQPASVTHVEQTNPEQSEENREVLANQELSKSIAATLKTKLGSRLPKLVENYKNGTSIAEFEERGDEVGSKAYCYALEAHEKWETTKANLDHVNKVAIDLMPQNREHNESEAEFALRNKEYRLQVNSLCERYRVNEQCLRAYYMEQKSVYEEYCMKKYGKLVDPLLPGAGVVSSR